VRHSFRCGLAMAAAVFIGPSVSPAMSQDFPLEWHWVHVMPRMADEQWEVQNGIKADVNFTGQKFTARLFDSPVSVSANDPVLILEGRVRGKTVTAIETQPGTDAGRTIFTGTIVRDRTRLENASNGWGSDRISLTAGNEFIGLSRAVRSGSPPPGYKADSRPRVETGAASSTYESAIKPYSAALNRLCPEKHLEILAAGDFNVIIEEYLATLSTLQLKRWKVAAQPMCVRSEAGVSCVNIANIWAAEKLQKLDDVAAKVCRSDYVCSTQFGECRQQHQ
jgi:hypothetical protein